ncbi:unnamed protein product [Mytilus coruscus]|uniref:Tyrosine-protein kinase ephrin type A/B receptor-like domain-containing protein n=1 Tax=Mytilus coruscus TaxID=42192 RepID=A0A6J8CCM9_MYTCO|nr:unnamed protein product [Mytilus coruscus]
MQARSVTHYYALKTEKIKSVQGIQQLIDVQNCGFEIELSTQDKALFQVGSETSALLNESTFYRNIIENITSYSSTELGISEEYAQSDYNITADELSIVLEEVKTNMIDDPVISEIANVTKVAYDMINSGMDEANSLPIISSWLFEMGNVTVDYFDTNDCFAFQNCLQHTFSVLYDQFADISIEKTELSRNITVEIEDIFVKLILNDSLSTVDIYQITSHMSNNLIELSDANMFCSSPTKFVSVLQNQTFCLEIHSVLSAMSREIHIRVYGGITTIAFFTMKLLKNLNTLNKCLRIAVFELHCWKYCHKYHIENCIHLCNSVESVTPEHCDPPNPGSHTQAFGDEQVPPFGHEVVSTVDIYQITSHLSGNLIELSDANMFCSSPPKFDSVLQNQTFLSGDTFSLVCNVTGDPCPQCAPGSYYLFGDCIACPLGTYTNKWNQNSCVNCPTGYTTDDEGSVQDTDCYDSTPCHNISKSDESKGYEKTRDKAFAQYADSSTESCFRIPVK